jgi:hypothetical protein
MFLCRWTNGDFSYVNARTKDDAIESLDQFGNAEQATITRMPECLFDFRLNDRGEIVLAQIGAATEDFVRETCYPDLEQIILDARADDGEYTPEALERIRTAVEHERTRLSKDLPDAKPADTEIGRDLQRKNAINSAPARAACANLNVSVSTGLLYSQARS